ncbi:MAG: family 1 glycosylhydrolase [Christensenellales bacterium]
MLENGIRPFVTLFHWDYPQALQDRGAWANPDSPVWFEEYAALCARRFGDRVKDFITFNEPQCFIGLGYGTGACSRHGSARQHDHPHESPPVKAHGLAVRALRTLVPDCRIGYAPCGDVSSLPAPMKLTSKPPEKPISRSKQRFLGV